MAIVMDVIPGGRGLMLKECPHQESTPYHKTMLLFAWNFHAGN